MIEYKIYVLNGQNNIQQRHDIVAPDDVTALEKAKALVRTSTLEVWESARLIARIGVDGETAS